MWVFLKVNYLMILVVIKSQSTGTVSDKVRNRLEQLDDFEEVGGKSNEQILQD